MQASNTALGLGKVCFHCGIPDGTDGMTLLACARCDAAFYCSKVCQAADWSAGHKLDCVRSPSAQGISQGYAHQTRPASSRPAAVAAPDPAVALDTEQLNKRRERLMRAAARTGVASKVRQQHGEDHENLDAACAKVHGEVLLIGSAEREFEETGKVVHNLRINSFVSF